MTEFDREAMTVALLAYVGEELVGEGPERSSGQPLAADDDLLGSGLLDSLAVMRLIQEIEGRYRLTVPPVDVTIDNFMTVQRIVAYLESLGDSGERAGD